MTDEQRRRDAAAINICDSFSPLDQFSADEIRDAFIRGCEHEAEHGKERYLQAELRAEKMLKALIKYSGSKFCGCGRERCCDDVLLRVYGSSALFFSPNGLLGTLRECEEAMDEICDILSDRQGRAEVDSFTAQSLDSALSKLRKVLK